MRIGTCDYFFETQFISTKTFTVLVPHKVVLNYNGATFNYHRAYGKSNRYFLAQIMTNKKGLSFLGVGSKEYKKVKNICKILIKFYTKEKLKKMRCNLIRIRNNQINQGLVQ